jgi:hypothetical protein
MYVGLRCYRFESKTGGKLAVPADLQWGSFLKTLLPTTTSRAHLIMGPSAGCAAGTVSLPSSAVLNNGRHCVGRRAAQRRRPKMCSMATAWESLRRRHSRAPPPPLRSSRAAATAAWQVPRPAPCSRRPRRLLAHAARARASRRRAPRAAAHERLGIDYGRCYGLALVRDRVFTCHRVFRRGDSCAGSTR